jgi:hypothetical protein
VLDEVVLRCNLRNRGLVVLLRLDTTEDTLRVCVYATLDEARNHHVHLSFLCEDLLEWTPIGEKLSTSETN